jgi:hypothetical protein
MNVYMSHFGKQVETVTTHSLLDSWLGGMRAPGIMSARIYHRVEILLPKENGSRSIRIGSTALTERFGGATSFLRAPGQGPLAERWRD